VSDVVRLVAVIAVLAAGPACDALGGKKPPGQGAAGDPAAPGTVAAARPKEPLPDPITHPCVVAAAQYDQTIAQGSVACAADSDCGCYAGGIGKSGCGGVSSAATVAKLAGVAKRFHDMKCRTTVDCAAWACRPKCEGGRCRR
jgi:hypothetical protein